MVGTGDAAAIAATIDAPKIIDPIIKFLLLIVASCKNTAANIPPHIGWEE